MENENPQAKQKDPTVSWVMSQQLYDKLVVPSMQHCLSNALNKNIEEWYISLRGLHMAVGMFFGEEENEEINKLFYEIHQLVYDASKNRTLTQAQNRQASSHKTIIWHKMYTLQIKIHRLMHTKKMFFFGKTAEDIDSMADWG